MEGLSRESSRACWYGSLDLIPDELHTLGFFDDLKCETVSSTMDQINKRYGQHTVYLGGLHGLGDAAPTRGSVLQRA